MKEINTTATTRKPVVYSQNSVLAALAVIIVILLSFYVGTLYQKSHNPPGVGIGMAAGRHFGRFDGAHPNIGTVSTVSATSITINRPFDNAAKTYTINSSTKVTNNGQSASVSDIKTGDRVLVRTSGSGSTTATQIDINPSFGGGMMPGAAPGSTT